MNMRRIIIVVLIFLTVFAARTFAAGRQEESADQATLIWMALGPGKQKDADEVWTLWNEKLQDYLPGTTVEFEVISGPEFPDRFKLAMAAQEQIDIANRMWGQSLAVEVSRGSFTPLDDLLAKYGRDLTANLPDWALQKGSINGVTYNIPCFQWMQAVRYGIRFPVELADMTNVKEVCEDLQNFEFMEDESYAALEPYFEAALASGNIRKGISPTFWWMKSKGYELLAGGVAIEQKTTDYQVLNLYETDAFQAAVRYAASWFRKGYIRKDILGADEATLRKDDGKQDGAIAWVHGYYSDTQSAQDSTRYGFPIHVYPVVGYDYIVHGQTAIDLCIPSTAKYPEKAMQVLNLTQSESGKDMYRLLVFGIEGKHYDKVSDDVFEPIGYNASQGSRDSPYGLFRWAMGNTKFAYTLPSEGDYTTEFVEVANNAVPSPLMGFTLDIEPISNEISQIKAVESEFHDSLMSGSLPDPEATYKDFLRKLDAAGIDKVQAEAQKQIDAWRASR